MKCCLNMKQQKRRRFEEALKKKEIKELLVQYADLNTEYHTALKLFLMHPTPSCKETDLDFISSLKTKVYIVKNIINQKVSTLNQQ